MNARLLTGAGALVVATLFGASAALAQTSAGVSTTISCSQAAFVYDAEGACRNTCGANELDATDALNNSFQSADLSMSVSAEFCPAGSVCCVVPTEEMQSAFETGSLPPPNMTKLLMAIGNQSAAEEVGGASSTSETAGPDVAATLPDPLSGVNLPQLIGNIIHAFTGIAGAAALLFFVYGGVMYILSGGDDTKVKKAREILKNASIGLILIFGAYFFTSAIIGALLYNPQTVPKP